LRHGESDQRSKTTINDAKRSLTDSGKKELEVIAKALAKLGIKFDYVFYSPLVRARQTASIILKEIKCKSHENLAQLSPEGNRLELYNKLSSLKQDSSVLIVGHEPYLSQLVSEAISDGTNCRIELKKAGLVRIRTISYVPKLRGEMRWLLTPKHLKYMIN
jgi:phosphohistidine phosphatase